MSEEKSKNMVRNSPLKPNMTYTKAVNQPFYAAVPAQFKQYYEWHVRQWLSWFDGHVHWFHNTSSYPQIFSTRIAHTICDKLSKQVTGGRLLFDDNGEELQETKKIFNKELNALEFIEEYFKRYKINGKLQTAVKFSLAAGDAAIKLNAYNNELAPTSVRKDNYFFDTDAFGKLEAFSTLIHHMTRQIKNDNRNDEEHFYIVEERRYADKELASKMGVRVGRPLYRMSIKRGDAHGVSYKKASFHSADFQFNDLKPKFRDELKDMFGHDLIFNKWSTLPLKDLGVYILKSSDGVSFNPSLPFGESVLSNLTHILQSYDYYYTLKNLDLTIGKGRVMLPRGMSSPQKDQTGFSTLEKVEYERIQYSNPDDQKPVPIQFDLRSQSWKEIRDNLLQEASMEIGINPRSLATFIVPSSEKPSAHEISTDEDETALWVENKRDLAEPELNAMVESILYYYNYDSEVTVKFSKKGLSNRNSQINQLAILAQNGMVDEYTKLEMAHPDKNEKQLKKMLKNIREERQNNKPDQTGEENKTIEENTEDQFRQGENQIPRPDDE